MAFLGRVNSQGALIDCEVFCGRAAMGQTQQDSACQARKDEASALVPRRKGSRTFIKTCDKDSLVRCMGSPSTVRYVGSSGSCSEVNSLDETEISTLRCCSDLSLGTLMSSKTIEGVRVGELGEDAELQTESETVCLHLGSTSSSASSDRSSSSGTSYSSSRSGNSTDKDSTTSMCSWEEAMSQDGGMLSPLEEPLSHSLPSLRLGSDGGGSPPLTYTRRIAPLQIQRSAGEAYENWLSGKQRQCQYKLQAKQAEIQVQRQRTELRQRLAKEKYEQWCQQKAQQAASAPKPAKPANTASTAKPSQPAQLSTQKNAASVQHHLQEWEMQKLRQLEQRRQEQRNAERRRLEEKAVRRSQAEEAFSRWMSNVAQRPKPVPASQGMKSLRGTVSDIFINPKQWVD
ncbi:uncharacterized protein LOC6540922 [Drosophila erecta]|uniref:Coiled-coil domain-containing protein n=1 Tax=Drosophila erecta TaxID=7220 RepID=B3N4Y1_DROER|nr:uncharacterized protein LOC6540922 [Drosophila erecta]EDV57883.1 uncharacterized protein Dere_GG24294 [Drosophila erecta]